VSLVNPRCKQAKGEMYLCRRDLEKSSDTVGDRRSEGGNSLTEHIEEHRQEIWGKRSEELDVSFRFPFLETQFSELLQCFMLFDNVIILFDQVR